MVESPPPRRYAPAGAAGIPEPKRETLDATERLQPARMKKNGQAQPHTHVAWLPQPPYEWALLERVKL